MTISKGFSLSTTHHRQERHLEKDMRNTETQAKARARVLRRITADVAEKAVPPKHKTYKVNVTGVETTVANKEIDTKPH